MRQESLERLLVHHPLDCRLRQSRRCKLQDLVFEYGIKAKEYQAPEKAYDVPYATDFDQTLARPLRHVLEVRYRVQRNKGRLRFGSSNIGGISRISGNRIGVFNAANVYSLPGRCAYGKFKSHEGRYFSSRRCYHLHLLRLRLPNGAQCS